MNEIDIQDKLREKINIKDGTASIYNLSKFSQLFVYIKKKNSFCSC